MPIAVRLSDVKAKKWPPNVRVKTPAGILRGACEEEHARCEQILWSSFTSCESREDDLRALREPVWPSENGLLWATYAAYGGHHRLTLRPEDVWFAVLSQLGFYINAQTRDLQPRFIAYGGELRVTSDGVNFANDVRDALKVITENLMDQNLSTWIEPSFTTTSWTDIVTAGVLMMDGMQNCLSVYPKCKGGGPGGIPSVNLMGERDDWAKIRRRLDQLPSFGEEPAQFAALLQPVLDRFIYTFEENFFHPEVSNFWSKIVHKSSESGVTYLSGWITAFCFWSPEGKLLYSRPSEPPGQGGFGSSSAGCDLDGTLFHCIDTRNIPGCIASVPVKLDYLGIVFNTRLVGGSVGIKSHDTRGTYIPRFRWQRDVGRDTTAAISPIQTITGCWLYMLTEEAAREEAAWQEAAREESAWQEAASEVAASEVTAWEEAAREEAAREEAKTRGCNGNIY